MAWARMVHGSRSRQVKVRDTLPVRRQPSRCERRCAPPPIMCRMIEIHSFATTNSSALPVPDGAPSLLQHRYINCFTKITTELSIGLPKPWTTTRPFPSSLVICTCTRQVFLSLPLLCYLRIQERAPAPIRLCRWSVFTVESIR